MTITRTDKSLKRSVALSGATQLAARAVDLGVNVVVSVLILRHLGPTGNGDYVLVITAAGIVGLLAEFGLPKLAVREISRDPDTESAVLGTVTVLRLVTAVIGVLLVQIALIPFGPSTELRLAGLVASIAFVVDALMSIVIVFQARVEQQYEALARTIGTSAKLLAVLAVVATGGGVVEFVAVSVVALTVTAIVANVLGRRRLGVRSRFESARVRPLLRAALPIGPAALVGVLYLKLDAAMVALLADREDLGIYGAAYQPVEYLLIGSAVAIQILFPILARAVGDPVLFAQRYALGVDVVAGVFAAFGAVMIVVAGPLVGLAYGADYERSAAPLAILTVALAFMAVNAWQGFTLLTVGRQARNLAYLGIAVAVNVAIDAVLITWLGLVGAAWGTLITAAGLAVGSTIGVRRHAGVSVDPATLTRLGLAAVFAGVAAALVDRVGGGVAVAVLVAMIGWVLALPVLARPTFDRLRDALSDAGAVTPMGPT